MRKNIVSLAILFLVSWQALMANCLSVDAHDKPHFISDGAYRSKVENAFESKMKLVGRQFYQVKGMNVYGTVLKKKGAKETMEVTKQKLTTEEQEALQFLYAYMPVADVTDYPTSFFLENVRTSFEARKEMSWGKDIPELLFRHFVLPIRVNNENLDDSRMIFFKELKERVKGMGMKDAILEVNHWCHERVTYQPSDGRTSAPLATIRSAYGRCGEESTFTVAALRAIGIPARQVYTPRWAHTDDNHAWVEAWADGKWYFLGACEPEAVLNLAWFNAPASRAMLMHTKAFGDYNGPEEVMLRTSNYTEINLIDNYGSSARIDFSVVDAEGKPVEGARVDFKIYNYAEFCSVVTKYTAQDGKTFLSAGKGDMMVWASKDGKYGFVKASFGKANLPGEEGEKARKMTIRLDRKVSASNMNRSLDFSSVSFRDSFDIVPPPEKANIPEVSAEARAKNLERFAYEDSIRHAYLATFYTKETALEALQKNGLLEEKYLTRNGVPTWMVKGEKVDYQNDQKFSDKAQKLVDFLVGSWGNHEVILKFLMLHQDNLSRAIELLSTLSAKDLRDMQMDILEDHFNAHSNQLSPRVEDEMIIHPFKQFFEEQFEKMKTSVADDRDVSSKSVKANNAAKAKQSLAQVFRQDLGRLVDWVMEIIRMNPDK